LAFGALARVLEVLFFVLGPLALVFSIPRPSDLGARWFRIFVTVVSWPIFSGLILAIVTTMGLKGMYAGMTGALAAILGAVVLVAPDGASTYLERSVVEGPLLGFIAEQKGRPSEATIAHFSRRFIDLFLAVNSSTIEEAWPEAISMMGPPLAGKVRTESVS